MKNYTNCPHCKQGKVWLIKGQEPYSVDHYQCDYCDSTYNDVPEELDLAFLEVDIERWPEGYE